MVYRGKETATLNVVGLIWKQKCPERLVIIRAESIYLEMLQSHWLSPWTEEGLNYQKPPGSWATSLVFADSGFMHGNESSTAIFQIISFGFFGSGDPIVKFVPRLMTAMPGKSVILIEWFLTSKVTNLTPLSLWSEKVRLASIHEAVRYGDVLELQSMVQRGAGINDPDPKFKFTPLHWAAHHGSLEVCRWIEPGILTILALVDSKYSTLYCYFDEVLYNELDRLLCVS